jgi:hypothetical protein
VDVQWQHSKISSENQATPDYVSEIGHDLLFDRIISRTEPRGKGFEQQQRALERVRQTMDEVDENSPPEDTSNLEAYAYERNTNLFTPENFLTVIGPQRILGSLVTWLSAGILFFYETGFEEPYGRHNLPASIYFTIQSGLSVGAGPVYPGAGPFSVSLGPRSVHVCAFKH